MYFLLFCYIFIFSVLQKKSKRKINKKKINIEKKILPILYFIILYIEKCFYIKKIT